MTAAAGHEDMIPLLPVRPVTRHNTAKSRIADTVAAFESMNETMRDFFLYLHRLYIPPAQIRARMRFKGYENNDNCISEQPMEANIMNNYDKWKGNVSWVI